jgi:23S rRNA (cytosine1962-C5)-methyltransferase
LSKYQLLDSGQFMKLEQVGPFRIARPSVSAVWDRTLSEKEWARVDAVFERYSDGNGDWKIKNPEIKNPWTINLHGIVFNLKLTGFGHLGIFSEQEKNWLQIRKIIEARKEKNRKGGEADKPFKVLNLFAYTGGSTLFAAQAGAEVVHLDASKSSVAWARENAVSSGLEAKPIRWIIDDVQDFVKKEVRRGNKYQGIILDPPSYGRGSKNQVWKIEEHLLPLLKDLRLLMPEDFSFCLLSSHSPGYTPISLENQLKQICKDWGSALSDSGEMLIYDSTQKALPSGAYALFQVES